MRTVFATYLDHMLDRRERLRTGTKAQFRQWLIYLARQMYQWDQGIFHVEELHPAWLPEKEKGQSWGISKILPTLSAWLRFYIISTIFTGLVIGAGLGLVFGCLVGLGFGPTPGLQAGMAAGLMVGCFSGLNAWRNAMRISEAVLWSWTKAAKFIVTVGLCSGVMGGLLLGLIAAIMEVTHGMKLSGPNLLNLLTMPRSFLSGGTSILDFLLGVMLLLFGMTLWGGLWNFMSDTWRTEKLTTHSPNEGIWRSGKNGLFFWLVLTLILICTFELTSAIGVLFRGPSFLQTQVMVLAIGLGMGTMFPLVRGFPGLTTFFLHFQLRFWLWRSGVLPWKLIPFLDEAEKHLLLRRIGGGYTFIHSLLLGYLVSLEVPVEHSSALSDSVAEQRPALDL